MADAGDWTDLSDDLGTLLALDLQAQAEWLGEMSGHNPQRAARLRSILDARDAMESAGFLSEPLAREPGTAPALIGTLIGAWTIEAQIGYGGMGTVWRGRRNDGRFEGYAAIKFLNFAELGGDAEQRFQREGILLGSLSHPNIARLLDAGVHGDVRQPYLVMEYVDGLPIDEWCDSRALGLPARVAVFAKVLDAVAHAHSYLIIHRDLKPKNILVTAAGEVKLLDFGIAKLADDRQQFAPTRSSVTPMTPQYAAPEQWLGDTITTRTDVYSLGLVLYELLSGRHALSIEDHQGVARRMPASARELPLMSSAASLDRTTATQLRGDLDTIVAKAVQTDPQRRYPSVGAFAEDLSRFLRHEPVVARADTVRYRVSKFVRRNRGGVVAASLTALSLILAVVMTTSQMLEARRQRDLATLESRRAETSSDFLQLVLSENRLGERAMTSSELLARAEIMLEQQYADDPAFVARMYLTLAGERDGRREYDRAAELISASIAQARRSGDVELEAQAECQYSFLESGRRALEVAQAHFDRAQDLLGQIGLPGWQADVQCLSAAANIAGAREDGAARSSADALELLQTAKARIEAAGATHRRTYTSVLSHLAVVFRARGDIPRAIELVRLGGSVHERNGRGQTRSRLIAMNNEAVLLSAIGEYLAGFAAHLRLQDRLSRLEPAVRFSGNFAINYVRSAARMDDTARRKAAVLLPDILTAAEARGDNLVAIDARIQMLRSSQIEGGSAADVDRQIAALNTMLDKPGQQLAADYRIDFATELVRKDLRQNDIDSARKHIAPLLANLNNGVYDQGYRDALLLAARVSLHAQDYSRAIQEAEKALPMAEKVARGPDSSGLVGELLAIAGESRLRLGHRDEARAVLQRALLCLRNGYGADNERIAALRVLLAEWGAT